jgi:hypothetical protein
MNPKDKLIRRRLSLYLLLRLIRRLRLALLRLN